MAKLIYALSGERRGHATRARAVIDALRNEHASTVYTYGQGAERLGPIYRDTARCSRNQNAGLLYVPAMTDPSQDRIQALEARLQRLESNAAIERLQYIYGYYLDNRMWDAIVALFTEDGEVEIGRRGIYRGTEQLRTFFHEVLGGGRSGRGRKELHNHIQMQGVVSLNEPPLHAFGRFRALAQFAQTLADGSPGCGWAEGVYENEYVLRDGAWRLRVVRWVASFYGALPAEAVAAGRPSAPVSQRFAPSAPATYAPDQTGAWALPFHYAHPISGEKTPVG
jgi:hypothetical protein